MAFKGEAFSKVVYAAVGGTGKGASAADPLPLVDGDLFVIEAGMLITNVSVVVTTAITVATQMDIGDDDDQNGFVAAATLTANAASANSGAYLASGAQKYYAAAGKEVKLDMTGTAGAGAICVVISGYKG